MRRLAWALPLLLVTFAASAEENIEPPVLDKIHFAGNKVTRASVMRQEMVVKEGQPYSPQQVEKSRRALMNMGLFKSVRIEPLHEQGKNILLVTVDERFYILPLPLLDYRPSFLADETANNYSYGGEIRFDNLFGLNQRLKISYREKKYEDDIQPQVKLAELHYVYPHVVGTPYHIDLKLGTLKTNIWDYSGTVLTSNTSQSDQYGSIVLSRWLNSVGISKGWRAGIGASATTTNYGTLSGVSPYRNHDEYALIGNIGYHMVNNYPYHREGFEYNYSMQFAGKAFTSDNEYFRNNFSYRRYIPLMNGDANFNTQLLIGLATGDEPAYSLGNSTSLRGYDSDTLNGNVLLQGNFEYHHHISGYRQLRGVLFMDVANVWPELNEIDRLELFNCVGIGARWRVQSFVDVNLRLDFAYNTAMHETKTYIATTASF
jgi:outer membrane protein assembly factor BamA